MKDKNLVAKRRLSFVFVCAAICAAFLCAFALFACTPEDEHTHTLKHHAAVAPSCSNAGSIEYWECTGCGKLFSDSAATAEVTSVAVAATGEHSWGSWKVTTRATCTEEGERSRMCSVCGTTQTEAVPAAHSLEARAAVPATCGASGMEAHYYCSQCHKYFADEGASEELTLAEVAIPATGSHTYGEWSQVAVDCTHGGERTRTCTVCGRVDRDSVSPTGHDMTHHAAVPATCASGGMREYWECGICGLLFTDSLGNASVTAAELVISATGIHSYGAWEQTLAPDCTAEGSEKRVCSVCGDEETRSVEALGHDMQFTAENAATCEAAGNVAYYHCNRCNLNFDDDEGSAAIDNVTIAKPDHNMTHHAAVPVTCTEGGNIEYWSCSICNKNYLDEKGAAEAGEVVLAAINHKNMQHFEAVKKSCTSDGNIEYYYCPDCEKYFGADMNEIGQSDTVIPGGHELSYVGREEATCGDEGMEEHWKCSVCGMLFTDAAGGIEVSAEDLVIPVNADGHVYSNHKCTICGHIQPPEEYGATTTLNYSSYEPGRVQNIGGAAGESQIVIPAYRLTDSGDYVKVTSIGNNAFKDYTGDVIVIPGTVIDIMPNAFTGCTAAIIFEGTTEMKTLANNAFAGYAGEMIILPDGLQSIGDSLGYAKNAVFKDCVNLNYLYIPKSVTFMAAGCFDGCQVLGIYYEGTQEEYDAISKENYSQGAGKYTEEMNVPRPQML